MLDSMMEKQLEVHPNAVIYITCTSTKNRYISLFEA